MLLYAPTADAPICYGSSNRSTFDGLTGGGGGGVPDLPPVNITPPVVSGDAVVGEVLHTTDGTWQYNPFSFLYIWRQDGGVNCTGDGATTADYTPNEDDIGFPLFCSIVAQNSAGDSLEVNSNNSDEVEAAPPPDPGLPEITEITFLVGGSGVGGHGFAISNASARLGIWFNTDGQSQPDMTGLGVTSYIEVGSLTTESSAQDICGAAHGALDANGFTINSNTGTVLTVQDDAVGTRVDPQEEFASLFSFNVTQQGTNPS